MKRRSAFRSPDRSRRSRTGLIGAALAAWLALAGGLPAARIGADAAPLGAPVLPRLQVDPLAEDEMLRLINRERAGRGLTPLVMDPVLRDATRDHAADMIRRHYFAHDSPEGVSPWERLARHGIAYTVAGENLARAPNVGIAHRGLMASPDHRENILLPLFARVGIGAIRIDARGVMFVQEFAG